jgi:thiol-disulfide isomerase/thioredoxin
MNVRMGQSALSRVEAGFESQRWVNSGPLTVEELRGQVVLLDFWEYTCVNWIRTAPYLKAWHRAYADTGLVVIGAHAPEFEFGERAENIDRGIRDHGLTYPIVLDNDFTVWQAVGNHAWPAKYLYDAYGNLVDQWIGEGNYAQAEAEIRRLLAESGASLPPVTAEAAAFAKVGEPSYRGITEETYVGAERGEPGTVSLTGDWQSHRQYIELQSGTGTIDLPFTAGEVNLVLEPGPAGVSTVTVQLDGQPVGPAAGAGVDPDGVARIDRSGMARLIAGAPKGEHVLTLVANDPGLHAYVFTFGP